MDECVVAPNIVPKNFCLIYCSFFRFSAKNILYPHEPNLMKIWSHYRVKQHFLSWNHTHHQGGCHVCPKYWIFCSSPITKEPIWQKASAYSHFAFFFWLEIRVSQIIDISYCYPNFVLNYLKAVF